MERIEIKDEYITLGQFLKVADIIASGGEAKIFLNSNIILINDEEDNRRGRKLHKGDKVNILGVDYLVC